MQTLWQDLRYAARLLMKTPGFTLVALVALALGIGASTAIFSVVNAVLWRPLPYKDADRLTAITGTVRRDGAVEQRSASYPDFADWREQNSSFEKLAAWDSVFFNLLQGDEPERLNGELASADYFLLLGVQAIKGRTFTAEEDSVPDARRVALVSYGLWQRRFGADPELVGQTIKLSDGQYTVVGIMPEGFRGLSDQADLWLPVMMISSVRTARILQQRQQRWHSAVGRLKPGVTVEQAQIEMDALTGQLEQAYPETNTNRGARVTLLHEQMLGGFQLSLLVLFGAVVFVLAIACANVANLLVARATSRHKDTAIRTALGATRWRLLRQWLSESLLLALLGGGLGVLLALWCTDLLTAINPVTLPSFTKPTIDGRVLGFTLLISLTIGVLFGLTPVLQFSRLKLSDSLKEGGRQGTSNVGGNRLRSALVISEIALALVLLIGAALMIRSFQSLQTIDLGFASDHLLTMNISLPARKYNRAQLTVFNRQLLERLQSLPATKDIAISSDLPFEGNYGNTSAGRMRGEGIPEAPPGDEDRMHRHRVSPGFFAALGIPVIKGRDFTEQDDEKTPGVVIIREDLARRYWPGEDPINKRLEELGTGRGWLTVVGIVGEVKYRALPQNPDADPDVYFPLLQFPDRDLSLAVRTTVDPTAVTSVLRSELQKLDPELPVFNMVTMAERIARQTTQSRFSALLLGIFGIVALLLASVGIYGVMSYTVSQRTHEIGIRLALGAQTRDVLKLVVKQGMRLTLCGIALGLGAAFLLTRLLAGLLFGIKATDPLTYSVVALILTGVALTACLIPARRAAKVDPMIALRYE